MDTFAKTVLTAGEFINRNQLSVILDATKGEEGQWFKDKLVSIADIVSKMPKTYEQDGKGDLAVVYLHYFEGGCDWYITEKDMEAEQNQAFGFANVGAGVEMGYISIIELLQNNVELDLHFEPTTVGELRVKGRID